MAAIEIRRALRIVIAAASTAIFLAGCNSAPPAITRADYTATLNKYYEGRPMCLWPETVKFPAEDVTPDEATERGFAALVDAGLLIRKPAGKHAPKGSSTFDLTPEGRSALDPDISDPGAGNFCYGRRKITSIDRDRQNSHTTELIDFHYALPDPAAWSKEHSIETAFPQVVSEISSPHKAQVTLLDTTDGWEVSGTPAEIPTFNAPPRKSALAKAKSLFSNKKQQPS
jgi:hypothetical protein